MGVDKNGPAKTGGTGIKQLRENIAESKLSYEIMDDAAQVFLKSKIMDNIHKYFYLIVFTAYMRQAAELAKDAGSDDEKKKNGLTGGKISTPSSSWRSTPSSERWWRREKANFSGRETSQRQPWLTSSLWPPPTSRPTWARSSTTSTRRPTPCSLTCLRATTRREPSTGLPPRLS